MQHIGRNKEDLVYYPVYLFQLSECFTLPQKARSGVRIQNFGNLNDKKLHGSIEKVS
jgi:hypothetical protein